MTRPGPATKFMTAFAAASLFASSAASAAPVRPGNYLFSVTAMGAASYQAAVCATGAASAAAAGAATAAQAAPAQPGCVLPVVDAQPVAPVAEVPPPVYVPPPATGGGIGVLPLLLGLAAIAGGLYLLLDDDDDDEIELPISPG